MPEIQKENVVVKSKAPSADSIKQLLGEWGWIVTPANMEGVRVRQGRDSVIVTAAFQTQGQRERISAELLKDFTDAGFDVKRGGFDRHVLLVAAGVRTTKAAVQAEARELRKALRMAEAAMHAAEPDDGELIEQAALLVEGAAAAFAEVLRGRKVVG